MPVVPTLMTDLEEAEEWESLLPMRRLPAEPRSFLLLLRWASLRLRLASCFELELAALEPHAALLLPLGAASCEMLIWALSRLLLADSCSLMP